MLSPSRLTETPGLERPTQYWMTFVIGESPYYRSDCTRLLVTLIIVIFEAESTHNAGLRGVRYRRISFECQREKLSIQKAGGGDQRQAAIRRITIE